MTSTRETSVARLLVASVGGRYTRELGIDLDSGRESVDAWFCAATLFGTRISARTAVRTYRALAAAGVRTVADAGARSWDDLVQLLDAGGYARYDFRTATRLQTLAEAVRDRLDGTVSTLAAIVDAPALEAALDALPGWGPTTVRIFLRELRDIWPGARPPLDERALRAARHVKLPLPRRRADQVDALRVLARGAHVDVRDLEVALVRLALAHRDMGRCRGGEECSKLAELTTGG